MFDFYIMKVEHGPKKESMKNRFLIEEDFVNDIKMTLDKYAYIKYTFSY